MNILILEDDPVLSREIAIFLTNKEYELDVAADGDVFTVMFLKKQYDLFLLDINVPGTNGLEVCRRIRQVSEVSPIIMLTAYGDIRDKKQAFELGADDYLVKPFHFEELLLRIQALLRRTIQASTDQAKLIIGDLEINIPDSRVTRNQKIIDLTPKEYQILLLLARANGRTLSKRHIADSIWDVHFDSNYNTIEVYINFLRKKIDKGFNTKLIHTRSGFGYFLKSVNNDA